MSPRCPELKCDILASAGRADDEILNTADEKECDLIVLGTHGKGFLAHTSLGSVASAVLHRTRKPVLIIPLPSSNTAINEDGTRSVMESKQGWRIRP